MSKNIINEDTVSEEILDEAIANENTVRFVENLVEKMKKRRDSEIPKELPQNQLQDSPTTDDVVAAIKAAASLLEFAAATISVDDDAKVVEITRGVRNAIEQLNGKTPNAEQIQGSMESLRTFTGESGPANSLNTLISKDLMALGVPPHLSGFTYLVWSIAFVTTLANSSWRMSSVYDSVLSNMNLQNTAKNKGRAERCMRHAISVAFDRPCNSHRDYYFLGQTSADNGVPSISVFISVVAERIKLKRGMTR